jgi:hypothetical protein
MLADPEVGTAYREEFYRGEAEDMAQVVAVDGSAETPLGGFDQLVVTINWTPLEPDVVERKFYASGVGVVSETVDEGPAEVVLLVEHTAGA